MTTDDLEDRVRRLREETARDADARARRARTSRTVRAREDLSIGGRFAWQLAQGVLCLWDKIGRPLGLVGAATARRLWRWYRRAWALAVYRRDVAGDLRFSKTRAGFMVLGSILFFWYLLLPTAELVLWDAPLYLMTAQVDVPVYLNGSQQLDTLGGHAVEGCDRLPCSDQDAVYYRTSDEGWFNDLWSLWHGRGLYWAEYVGAAVPYQTSHCLVTYYGFRFRFTARYLNFYPRLLAVSCSGRVQELLK